MSDYDEERQCKLVLVGESGMGKTSIITRFTEGTFDKNSPSTVGASYITKKIQIPKFGQQINLNIWDTAGQETYRGLTKIFYKDASIAILVYDITNRKSFTEVQNYWYKQLKENGKPELIIGIAGNKSDLFDQEEVSEKEAEEFAKSIKAIFVPTSAFNGSGIEELFTKLGEEFLALGGTLPQTSTEGKNIVLDPDKDKDKDKKSKKTRKFC